MAKNVAGKPPASRSEGTPARKARTAQIQIEFVGVRVRGLMRCHSLWPGTAPSRENAYSIRELAVSEALPQKNWATQAMPTRILVPSSPMASTRIGIGAVMRLPAAVSVSKPGAMAKVTASSST